jgi:DNA polymerase
VARTPRRDLDRLHRAVARCTRCPLHESRTRAVPGEGPIGARLFFLGEGPGAEEDRRGRPFCGRSGRIFDELLAAAGIARERCFVTSLVKCRPPGNRNPRRAEIAACRPYRERQIELVRPRLVVLLGRVAVREVLGERGPLRDVRGRPQEAGGVTCLPTYHPAGAMRQPAARRALARDLRAAREWSGLSEA